MPLKPYEILMDVTDGPAAEMKNLVRSIVHNPYPAERAVLYEGFKKILKRLEEEIREWCVRCENSRNENVELP